MATDLLYLACFTGNLDNVEIVTKSLTDDNCKDMQLAYAICILCGHIDIAEYLSENYEISGTFLSKTALHKLNQIRTFANSVIDIKKNVVNFDEFMELHPEADSSDDEYDDNSVDEETSFDCSELDSSDDEYADLDDLVNTKALKDSRKGTIKSIKESIEGSSSDDSDDSDESDEDWSSDSE